MDKITIKDIFTPEENNEQPKPVSESRMIELMKSYDEKGEILKDKSKSVNQDKINEEFDRLKKIAGLEKEVIEEAPGLNTYTGMIPTVMGMGQSVNTFMGKPEDMNNSSVLGSTYGNKNKVYNPKYTYLQPSEALRLAISRVLTSGAPVNDLGFYEEVNWVLNGLGFAPKSPLDIKNTIYKMIKD